MEKTMNFLAHIYLSGSSKEIAIGNFIADFVKGTAIEIYPPEIQKGILLHRKIDTFTDSHETVKKSKKRLWTKYRHYSAVIVDVFYDHYLAKNWSKFSNSNLLDFTGNFYAIAEEFIRFIPQKAKKMLFYMKKDNWLYHYQYIEGIDQALTGMSKRAAFESHMEEAAKDLEHHYEAFGQDFAIFFPQLRSFVQDISKDSL